MSETKTCRTCLNELPISCFDKKNDNKDGLNHQCQDCRRAARGSKKRALPNVRSQEEITVEVLVQDILAEAQRKPNNWRMVAAADVLRKDPLNVADERVANILYDMWERRMRHQIDFKELDERCPVENERTIRRRRKLAESMDMCLDMEII